MEPDVYRPNPDDPPDPRFPLVWAMLHDQVTALWPDLTWAVTCNTMPDGNAVLGAAHAHGDSMWGYAVILPPHAVALDDNPAWRRTIIQRLTNQLRDDITRMN